MKIGDHIAVYNQFGWRHGVLISETEVVTLNTPEDSRASEPCRVSLQQFAEANANLAQIRTLKHVPAFSVDAIVKRAINLLEEPTRRSFSGSSEFMTRWCREGLEENPERLEARELEREIQTMDFENPVVRAIAKAAGVYSSEDLTAVCSRLVLPWLAVGDATELILRVAAQQKVPGDLPPESESFSETDSSNINEANLKTPAKKQTARAIGAASASILGFAAGGPLMGATTLASWMMTRRSSDNTVERIKNCVADEFDKKG